MEKWQETYLENTRQIARLADFRPSSGTCFEDWYLERLKAGQERQLLREDNISLLNRHLFPLLDDLHSASADTIRSLADFAVQLMDWTTNLDCGVYTVIHDALLSVCRVRRDRSGVIRQLYKLGMGYYFLRRFLNGVESTLSDAFAFQNEMLFTEAGSYIRYYDEIDDEETRGYIIRAMANIAICAKNRSRRIAVSARILQITQDPLYRKKAPNLPWDAFVRKTHQQMSANRIELTRADLTREELAAVLDSCYEVFRPEEQTDRPSVRWLWPYYEMEYSCGYVSLEQTLYRLEQLIDRTPADQFDMSGLYANVQLPVYYGRLMRDTPKIQEDLRCIRFLNRAYRKMLNVLLSCPPAQMDDYFFYTVDCVITDYFEIPGVPSYHSVTGALIRHFSGENYIRFRKTGILIRLLCETLLEQDPGYFNDLPFLADFPDPGAKKEALLSYAEECGLYADFGLLKMNIGRTMQTRMLFENEFRMFQMHTVSGHDDLAARPSTAHFADIALGHHRWYDGSGGYPENYIRTDSPYRQMTDVAACAAAFMEGCTGKAEDGLRKMREADSGQFSPIVLSCFLDQTFTERLCRLSDQDTREYYRELWPALNR